MSSLNIHAARCEALFVSCLQESQHPTIEQIRSAIQHEIRRYGVRQCVARVAQEYGEHPEAAVARMRWANEMVLQAHGSRTGERPGRLAVYPAVQVA